tara:strand:- start:1080 stop:1451 length:372 start_codon:yes stop_codon:yes gene_type:complete
MGMKRVAISFVLLVAIVLVLYYSANLITSHTGYFISELDSEFELCLKEKDVKLYVDDYDIIKLKELQTGDYLSSVEISGCIMNKIDCIREGIFEYPAWVIDGEKVEGDISVFELADLAGCEMV